MKTQIRNMVLFNRGGGVDPLSAAIATWQNTVSYTHAGGLPSDSFANNNHVGPGSNNYYTGFDAGPLNRIRQDGFIYQVKVKPYASATYPANIQFKIFRLNGSTYDVVSASETISITDSTLKTLVLATPMACKVGDYLGFTWEKGGADPYVETTSVSGATLRYVFDQVTTTNAFTATISNLVQNIEAFSYRPYLAITGDSIPAGWVERQSWYDAFTGSVLDDPCYQLQALVPTLRYQNHSKGVMTWAWVRSTGIVSALATNPKCVIIHCGVNDLNTARTWAQVVADMDAIQALAAANGAKLIIDELLPWTNGSDAQAATLRTWNTNYAAWCVTNNAKLAVLHDAMGKIRASTGYLDDLQTSPAYNSDGVHITRLGKQYMAGVWKPLL